MGDARLAIATEFRVVCAPDGSVWAPGGFGHDFWARHLGDAFESGVLVVRGEQRAAPPSTFERIDGHRVEVLVLPRLRLDWRIAADIVRSYRLLRATDSDAIVLFLPGVVGSIALVRRLLHRQRFSVRVVGDPLGVVVDAQVGGPVGRVAGQVLAVLQRIACRRAVIAAYVTAEALQRRYPPGRATIEHAYSDVDLGAVARHRRDAGAPIRRLVSVGSLEQRYKRMDLLVRALGVLRAEGWSIELDIVGGGRYLEEVEELARRLDLSNAVRFHGLLPRAEVHRVVAHADVFVLCSDTEGLPRAMVEAMAAGVACIGSNVGGIPELLEPVALFRAGSLDALVSTLRRFLVSDQLRSHAVAVGLERVASYAPDAVRRARTAFAADVACC